MFKNVASQKLTVFAFDATTNLPKDGDAANLTAYVNKDDGGATVLGDTSAAEIDATNAKGYYTFDLTQAETNADKLHFTGKSSTANIVVIGVPAVVYTLPANLTSTTLGNLDAAVSTRASQSSLDTLDDYVDTEIAAILAAVDTEIAAILAVIGTPVNSSIAADIQTLMSVSTTASGATVTVGSTISGTYANTATDDNVPFTTAPTGSGLDVRLTFPVGTDQIPTLLTINGYWNGSGQAADVYALNNLTAAYDKLSNTATRLSHAGADQNRIFILNAQHVDDLGDVTIKFASTSTNTGHRLNLDRVLVYAQLIGTAPLTAQQVWEYPTRTLTGTGGDPEPIPGLTAEDVWTYATRTLTSLDGFSPDWFTGFSTLDAADIRDAVGLASANLDTQLDALPTAAEIAAEDPLNATFVELAALPTTYLEWLAFLAQRFGAGNVVKAISGMSGTIETQTAAAAPLFTQAITDDGEGNQTVGPLELDS